MENIESILSRRPDLAAGAVITPRQAQELARLGAPDWLVALYSAHGLVGSEVEISPEHDPTGLGVEMKFLDPESIAQEALELMPGIAAGRRGYFPIGECMAGSGDPYFLKTGATVEQSRVVRIPHESVNVNQELNEEAVEIVSESLNEFLSLHEPS